MRTQWILASLLMFTGCMTDADDVEVSDEDVGGKADTAKLTRGTYELSSPTPDHIHIKAMVLLGPEFRNEIRQQTFSLDMTGTYRLSRLTSTGERRIRFTAEAEGSEPPETMVFAYQIAANRTITFTDRSDEPDAGTFKMKPAESLWCAEVADCESQGFEAADDGEVTCTQNQCGTSAAEAPTDCRTDGCSSDRVCRRCGAPPGHFVCTFEGVAC